MMNKFLISVLGFILLLCCTDLCNAQKYDSIKSFSPQQSVDDAIKNSHIKPIINISDSSRVSEGDIFWMYNNCSLIDHKGNTLFICPGNLITFFENKKAFLVHSRGNLIAYNKDMDILWEDNYAINHELIVTPENNIMLFSNEFDTTNKVMIRYDIIVYLDSNGKELYTWSTKDQRKYLMNFMMADTNIFRYRIKDKTNPESVFFKIAPTLNKPRSSSEQREFFHMNAFQIIPENKSEKKDSVFREGNILLSFCNYNDSLSSFIAVVNPVSYKILWHYVHKDRRPLHNPNILPNGNILYYVNSRSDEDSSYVEELNPISKEIVWRYVEKFHCAGLRLVQGSCQRLSNGNTLISNSNGFIYEVSPEEEIVWQWHAEDSPISVYRAFQLPEYKYKWLLNDE